MADKVHTLRHPVKNGEETIIEIRLGRLKAKHIVALPSELFDLDREGAKKEGEEKRKYGIAVLKVIVPFIAAVTELPEDVVGELDFEDVTDIAMMTMDFFEGLLEEKQ